MHEQTRPAITRLNFKMNRHCLLMLFTLATSLGIDLLIVSKLYFSDIASFPFDRHCHRLADLCRKQDAAHTSSATTPPAVISTPMTVHREFRNSDH